MNVLPGIRDRRLKDSWRGEVWLFDDPKVPVRICYVYGHTLAAMRLRKHLIAAACMAALVSQRSVK